MALYKCPECKSSRVLFALWFRDSITNLDIEAVYCRSCYYLSSFEGSLNPFRGFRKHNATSEVSMIELPEQDLRESNLPGGIYSAILKDRRNKI